MGCFLACLRVKDDDRPPRSRAVRPKKRPEPVVSRNSLSSLFQREEDLKLEGQESHSFRPPSTIKRNLREEAEFLEACGALKEFPSEIPKAARRLTVSPPDDANSDGPKFHSWFPEVAAEKLQPDKLYKLPALPPKIDEMLGEDLDSHSPSSCIENKRIPSISSTMASGEVSVDTPLKYHRKVPNDFTTPLAPGISITDAHHKNKLGRFECAINMFSSDNDQNLEKSKSPSHQIASKNSAYPTPLKFSDEMQTPGTVLHANMENLTDGMPRIRSQYVHSVVNPLQNASQWKDLKEDQYNENQIPDERRESLDQPEKYAIVKQEMQSKEASVGREMKIEASLPSWLKPPTNQQDERRTRFYRTPADRPIIGLVATHWHEEECPDNLPRVWDGNGIPNSTNKYKEDQKVSWHATPFEERLEKALSEESFVSQRKNLNGTPIAFDENEDCDTAVSRLQPSVPTVAKSVASC